MYIESIASGNDIPRGANLWSSSQIAKRRREYTIMANWDESLEVHWINSLPQQTRHVCLSSLLLTLLVLGDSTMRPGNIQVAFVEPPPEVTPEALIGARIWCQWKDKKWHHAKVLRKRLNPNFFLLEWEGRSKTTSVEQLLPLGDENSLQFQVAREELTKIGEVIYEDGCLRRSVRA